MATSQELESTDASTDPGSPGATQLLADLTERQARFAHLYAAHGNASRAARESGYSVKNAYSIGPKLTKKPSVRAAIHAIRAELVKAGEADPAAVIAQLNRQALGDITDLLVKRPHIPIGKDGQPARDADGQPLPVQYVWQYRAPDELTPAQRALVAGVSLSTRHMADGTVRQSLTYKTIDQQRSIEALARIMGMNQDKTHHTHSGQVQHKVSAVFAFIAANPENSETTRRIGQNGDGRRQPVTIDQPPGG